MSAAPGSAGARLAAWLQPEPRLDPNRCELKPIRDPVRFGWPTQLEIVTRDQYGDTVYIPDLKIEIKATPAGGMGHKLWQQFHHFSKPKTTATTTSTSTTPTPTASSTKCAPVKSSSSKTAAAAAAAAAKANINDAVAAAASSDDDRLPAPPKVPYEPTIKDKMSYKAVTFMKEYQPYSFEELRLAHPVPARAAETLIASDRGDYTFGAQWTPTSVGTFCLTCTIDGVALEEVHRIDVKDAGNLPPPLAAGSAAGAAAKQQKTPSRGGGGGAGGSHETQPPNRQRRFIASDTKGLRIRAHPTLQSEQVGVVQLDGVITFVDEQENDDGVWVRLSTESIRQHTSSIIGWYPTEAWCLQYNRHLDRTLLHPIVGQMDGATMAAVDAQLVLMARRNSEADRGMRRLSDFNELEQLRMFAKIQIGVDSISVEVEEGTVERDGKVAKAEKIIISGGNSGQRSGGYDFSAMQSSNPFIFANEHGFDLDLEASEEPSCSSNNPFSVDLFPSNDDAADGLEAKVEQPLAAAASTATTARPMAIPSAVPQAKDDSPRGSFEGGAGISSMSSSMNRDDGEPHAGPYARAGARRGASEGGAASSASSASGSGGGRLQSLHKWFMGSEVGRRIDEAGPSAGRPLPRLSTHKDWSELAAFSVRDLVKAMGGQNGNDGGSEAAGGDPEYASDSSSSEADEEDTEADASAGVLRYYKTAQSVEAAGESPRRWAVPAAVKYSPQKTFGRRKRPPLVQDDEQPDDANHKQPSSRNGSITTASHVAFTASGRPDEMSIADGTKNPTAGTQTNDETNAASESQQQQQLSKRALPSSLAESLRAVFAAFLWHEGIVHDAMACASFLKFHPELPKNLAAIDADAVEQDAQRAAAVAAASAADGMTREQRAQQRYSVEVANAGNYLNIRPSTLETLTKCGNSSVYNRRGRKIMDVSIFRVEGFP